MRIISGIARGHKLKAPKGNKVRPTEDRIKESLFNILGNIKSNSIVLDAFGGSGSIGIEFLSRGASKVYFVDNNYDSIVTIKQNLNHTKFLTSAEIIQSDIFIVIKRLSKIGLKFDYIYLDPPFNQNGMVDKAFKFIDKENILAVNGILVVEHEKELNLEELVYEFRKVDHRDYGSKCIDFYKKNIEEVRGESSLPR